MRHSVSSCSGRAGYICPALWHYSSKAGRKQCGVTPCRWALLLPASRRRGVDRQKLIIILVGLPGRGKTFLCNKLMCYLNWLGEEAL